MSFIDSLASFIADLMGCTDEECRAKARQYATWVVLAIIIMIIIIILPYIIRIIKSLKSKE